MRLVLIAPKIHNRTRPPHPLNDEHNTSALNIFNYYRIMLDRSKQIIPNVDAVVRCPDREILKILDSHSMFTLGELIEKIKKPIISTISIEKFRHVYDESKPVHNSTKNTLLKNLNAAISESTVTSLLPSILANGIDCELMQLDGEGWQKGKLKICFEFIPEEDRSVDISGILVEDYRSPLDEIRQLSNELASVGSIEQN